jgi:hypothetical protein
MTNFLQTLYHELGQIKKQMSSKRFLDNITPTFKESEHSFEEMLNIDKINKSAAQKFAIALRKEKKYLPV